MTSQAVPCLGSVPALPPAPAPAGAVRIDLLIDGRQAAAFVLSIVPGATVPTPSITPTPAGVPEIVGRIGSALPSMAEIRRTWAAGVVARILRHASGITQQRYIDPPAEEERAAVERIPALWPTAPGGAP